MTFAFILLSLVIIFEAGLIWHFTRDNQGRGDIKNFLLIPWKGVMVHKKSIAAAVVKREGKLFIVYILLKNNIDLPVKTFRRKVEAEQYIRDKIWPAINDLFKGQPFVILKEK